MLTVHQLNNKILQCCCRAADTEGDSYARKLVIIVSEQHTVKSGHINSGLVLHLNICSLCVHSTNTNCYNQWKINILYRHTYIIYIYIYIYIYSEREEGCDIIAIFFLTVSYSVSSEIIINIKGVSCWDRVNRLLWYSLFINYILLTLITISLVSYRREPVRRCFLK